MNNDETYTPCNHCGRPMAYCKGQCCGKNKGCQCKEYCGKVCGAIRPGEPKCPYQAVIPSLTVESVSNLKDLADCFVHVSDINTTFYIDDKHRIMTTWAGLVSVEDYDFAANPLNLRGQIAYDAKNNVAAIYDKQGANYIFQISNINNDYMLLEDKPQINGVTLEGNKTLADLGILDVDEVALVFDTVADMKASTNLVAGGYARTLGYHSIDDGGGATYHITDTEPSTHYESLAGDLYADLMVGSILNVKQMGAYGDNTHGDTTAIQAALDDTRCKTVYFPAGTYICNPLTMSRAIDLIGEESTLTGTSADPILDIAITGEYRNHFIKNLRFINNGTGNCLETNTTSSFITSKIENCFFQAESGWGIKTNEYFSHSVIELCTFSKNGTYLECGDANTVRKCLFYGIGTGIFLKPTQFGMLNNTIENNTIVNQGYAINVDRGDQVIIRNNQIEYGLPQTANSNNPNCSVFINGQYQTCHNVIIEENNFGGGSKLNNSIVIYSGKHCKITKNRFCSTAAEDIKVFNYYGGSNLNMIKDNIGYSNDGYRPRDDKWQPVRVAYDSSPMGVTNVWIEVPLENSTDKLYIMKDENNVVHFQPLHATFSASTTLMTTLPIGYRPALANILHGTYSAGSVTDQDYKVYSNGQLNFTPDGHIGACDINIPDMLAEQSVANID